MKYNKKFILKNGKELLLRNGTAEDGAAVKVLFDTTHGETDYLLSYPDENSYDEIQEAEFLQQLTDSDDGIEILAFVDGKLAGSAGIEAVGHKYKVKHRADFGISVLREFWGCGVGRALTNACIECANNAGYEQLELTAVAENEKALNLYKSVGFAEFGRNKMGFKSKTSGYQEIVYMCKEL